MESNEFFGESIVNFFNYKNASGRLGAAIGNHDFDFGLENMRNMFNLSEFPHLVANIYNKTDNSTNVFPNTLKNQIFQVGSLKVGVFGLSTVNTPQTTATSAGLKELEFQDYVNISIMQSKFLRENGADIVLLDAHVGVRCKNGNMSESEILKIRTKKTKVDILCNENDELYRFLSRIPSDILDGVIAGHKHDIVHHWINDIPVVVGQKNARYFNVLYLTYDKRTKKVIKDLTKIEGPVPICETLPDFRRSCFFDHEIIKGNITFRNLSFHNKIIKEDLGLKEHLGPYLEKAEKMRMETIGFVANMMNKSNDEESEMGNFVADVFRNHTNADVTLINRALMRIHWDKGPLTYYDLYETFPFEDEMISFEATGLELLSIIKVLQEGAWGFYITSGLKQHVCKKPHLLINVTLEGDREIEKDRVYKVASSKFIIHGGDDFAKVLPFFKPVNPIVFGNIREIVGHYIKELKILNSDDNRLMNPMNRRLILHDCEIKL